MNSQVFSSSSLFIFLFLVGIPLSLSNVNEILYESCATLFKCGTITDVDYPFWGGDRPRGCGYPGLELKCDKGVATIEFMSVKYRVLDIKPNDQVLKIARADFLDKGICVSQFYNTTLDTTPFDYALGYEMKLTFFYGCPPSALFIPSKFSCPIKGVTYNDGYVVPEIFGALRPEGCHYSVDVPVLQKNLVDFGNSFSLLDEVFGEGFDVRWKVDSRTCIECQKTNGRCGSNYSSNQFTCICPNQKFGSQRCTTSPADRSAAPQAAPPPPEKKKNTGLTVGTALGGAGFVGILIGCWLGYVMQRRKKLAAQSKSKDLPTPPSSRDIPTPLSSNFSQSIPSYPFSKSDIEKGSTYFGVQVFSYTELEEATNNFDHSRELGDGGFGTVYYGTLNDGRVVAVKRLYENNFKRVEQFMNEVEILTRLRHQNLVTLFGCTSKRSRELLLVYEYVANGTVADHLHGKRAESGLLTWPVRLSIAIETADALAYLHASDIIHRDVKTNNILLENNFRVKVADFGLSRLFPTDVTHVSTAPQGTPGYVDPEYYQCYQLTDKSDVYSFGVVLIELISSKQAVDTNRHRHDINLANMAINKIQNHTLHELVDPCLGFETDYAVKRMATSVAELAFRCLQQEKDMRPSMQEVLDGLRRIENEDMNAQKAEVVDILADDVGLLKTNSPPLSPDSTVTEKLVSSSTTTNSSG